MSSTMVSSTSENPLLAIRGRFVEAFIESCSPLSFLWINPLPISVRTQEEVLNRDALNRVLSGQETTAQAEKCLRHFFGAHDTTVGARRTDSTQADLAEIAGPVSIRNQGQFSTVYRLDLQSITCRSIGRLIAQGDSCSTESDGKRARIARVDPQFKVVMAI